MFLPWLLVLLLPLGGAASHASWTLKQPNAAPLFPAAAAADKPFISPTMYYFYLWFLFLLLLQLLLFYVLHQVTNLCDSTEEQSPTFLLAFDEWLPRRPPSPPFRYSRNAFISGSSITVIGRGDTQLRPFSVESKPTCLHLWHYSSPSKQWPIFLWSFLISSVIA